MSIMWGGRMARPSKCKRICEMPKCMRFSSSVTNTQETVLTVEEYETIRLIDGQDLSQEECAMRMNAARTTITRLYDSARKKMALYLMNGGILKIEGGSYEICQSEERCSGCCRKQSRECIG